MAADQTQHCQPRNIVCPIAVKRRIPHCKASGNRVAGPLPYGVSLRQICRVKIKLVHSNFLSNLVQLLAHLLIFQLDIWKLWHSRGCQEIPASYKLGAVQCSYFLIWIWEHVPKLIGIQSYNDSRAVLFRIALLMRPYCCRENHYKQTGWPWHEYISSILCIYQ